MTDKLKRIFTTTNLAIAASAAFVLSILPMLYLAPFNRANLDDYGFGWRTHAAWQATGSLMAVLDAAAETVGVFYRGWQGNWSSTFLNSLQPEVFGDGAYVIVTIVTLGLWVTVTTLVLYHVMVLVMGLTKSSFFLVNALFLVVNVHFVASKKSSLFFYCGIIVYQLSYYLCLLLISMVIQFGRSYRWRELVGIALITAYLGGAAYQSALLALATMGLTVVAILIYQRNRRVLWLLLPMVLLVVGLIVNVRAPGNRARIGNDFDFGVAHAISAIVESFTMAVSRIGSYAHERPMAFILLALMLIAIFFGATSGRIASRAADRQAYPLPGLSIVLIFCIYALAAYLPETYVGPDVGAGFSGGFKNFQFYTFTLMVLASGIYLAGWLGTKARGICRSRLVRFLMAALAVFLVVLGPVLAFSPHAEMNLRQTTFWVSFDYIRTGGAAEYRRQMELQTRIMRDENTPDAVVPAIHDYQGPLVHEPATPDPDAYTNSVMRQFYGKNSVVSMERTQWEEIYGHIWLDD